MGVTVDVPATVTPEYVSLMSVADPIVPMLTITLEPTGVTGVTGSGGKARNSAPPFPAARPSPESTTVFVPPGVNSKISPVALKGISATKRLPTVSKANPLGLLSPVATVLPVPSGVNLRIVSLPSLPAVDTKRLPDPSKARPKGNCVEVKGKAAEPQTVVSPQMKMLRTPAGVNL